MNNTGKKFGGRKAGTPNKVTSKAKELINSFVGDYFEKQFQADLLDLAPIDRLGVMLKLLEFTTPKATPTTVTAVTNYNYSESIDDHFKLKESGFQPVNMVVTEKSE